MTRRASRSLRILPIDHLEARTLLNGAVAAVWLGQDNVDLAAPGSGDGPSGIQDMHLRLSGLDSSRAVAAVTVRGSGGGQWSSPPLGAWAAQVVPGRDGSLELYIEPYQVETGRQFEIQVTYNDGTQARAWVMGGPADPALRTAAASLRATWLGQDGSDRVGSSAGVGPDAFQDAVIAIEGLTPGLLIDSVQIDGPVGVAWSHGVNHLGRFNAELELDPADPSRGRLFLQPDRDLADAVLAIEVVYATGTTDNVIVRAGVTEPGLPVFPGAFPTIANRGEQPRWLGQSTSSADAGLAWLEVVNLPVSRIVMAAVLANDQGRTWSAQQPDATAPIDTSAGPLAWQFGPSQLRLGFRPTRDEAGHSLWVRLVYDDGSQAILSLWAGATDLVRGLPEPALSETTARPGDDLQSLVGRYGTVRLTPGVYRLEEPLVLTSPVRVIGTSASTLLFSQSTAAPPWAQAIAVHASNTRLEGFQVRFEGPMRWDQAVSYGPAVIAAMGGGGDPLVNLSFAGLDLQSPPAASDWEQAVGLLRLVSAASGRIENNVLKGGLIEFRGGPWQITGNDVWGTPSGTYTHAVFSGHDPRNVVIAQNHVEPRGPSGKTWRFLVLTGSGDQVVVSGNTVVGVGPRDDDTVASINAAEIILTEAYRVRYEGAPLAISADRRLVRIPPAQGLAPQAGDLLAVVAGDAAGAWRRVAQVIDPQTLLLDQPLPGGVKALSVAPAFIGLELSNNRIDSRGSSVSVNVMLVGAQAGTIVRDNTLLGGRDALLLIATATEQPVRWGWTHTPLFDFTMQGNRIEDAVRGMRVAVEEGAFVKSTRGRVYLTGTIKGNLFEWSDAFLAVHPQPTALTLGDLRTLDPAVLRVSMDLASNQAGQPGGFVVIHAARVNGRDQTGVQWSLPFIPQPAPVPVARWLGQDGSDRVGRTLTRPDGFQDLHLRLTGLNPSAVITSVTLAGLGGGRWTWPAARGVWPLSVVRTPGAGTIDLYAQPYQAESGRPYQIVVRFDDRTSIELWVEGGRLTLTRTSNRTPRAMSTQPLAASRTLLPAPGFALELPGAGRMSRRSKRFDRFF